MREIVFDWKRVGLPCFELFLLHRNVVDNETGSFFLINIQNVPRVNKHRSNFGLRVSLIWCGNSCPLIGSCRHAGVPRLPCRFHRVWLPWNRAGLRQTCGRPRFTFRRQRAGLIVLEKKKKKCPFFLRLHGDVRGSGTNTGGGDDRHLRLLCECTNTSIQSASLCVTNYTKVFCNLKMSLGVWLSLLVSPLESRVLTKGGNALTQSKHAFFLDELTC